MAPLVVTGVTAIRDLLKVTRRPLRRRENAMTMSCTTGQLYTTTSAARQTSDTPDVALIRAISAGDKHAMQILFARHNVPVFRFLLRFVGNKSAAEDLVSEVFLDVWRQAGRFQGRSQVTTWLLAIARNKALSALRRRSTEKLDEDAAVAIEDPQDNPEVTVQNRQKSEILLNCLTQLSPAHREVIDLVYYHEKSIDEVAEITGIPPNTAKTRMFYARKRIAELMAAQGIDKAVV
jgi:RNA polymerase sigma-70 factor, ECF subfamily